MTADESVTAEGVVRVLIIDDSAYNRKNLTGMLDRVDGIEVVGRAGDGNEGLRQVLEHEPDVITLDLEMPKMDGFTFLRILMSKRPTPVVVVSSHSARKEVFRALELGALEFVAKPAKAVSPELRTIERELVDKIKLVGRLRQVQFRSEDKQPRRMATEPLWQTPSDVAPRAIVCLAASTGGPPALRKVIESLPSGLPVAIAISQHMPAGFTGAFARRLHASSQLDVREAATGDNLCAGRVLVAPGSGSLVFSRTQDGVRARVETPAADDNRIVPCADIMMQSAAEVFGADTLGIVLTGMGNDGSAGVQAISDAGGQTVAESEQTAVIYGMPAAAVKTGAVGKVLSLERVADAIVEFAESRR